MRAPHLSLLILFAIFAGLSVALHQGTVRIPPNWSPWGQPELDAPPTVFARLQINSLAADGNLCRAALDKSALDYRTLTDRPLKNGCGLSNGVEIGKSHVPYSRGFESTCALTAALYWYEARLDEAAVFHLGTTLARIDHFGTYSCRNVNNESEGRRSEHARANAIDISGFHFTDGSSVTVLKDWGKDTPKGAFLKAARNEACRFFNTVLGPPYNKLHANHFHLDMGRFRICS